MKKRSLTASSLIIVSFLVSLQIFTGEINEFSSKHQILEDPELNNLRTSASECGIAICDEYGSQWNPKICSSGSASAIIVWSDYRSGISGDIDLYAQKINSNGDIQWKKNGIIILNSTKINDFTQICSDGMGGAIMAWTQLVLITESSIYAQRIDSNGNVLWNSSGVLLYFLDNLYIGEPQICSDGAGGAIVIWYNEDSNSIYAQRINATGDLVWPGDGIIVCAGHCEHPMLCSDGAGGTIITWIDSRNYATNDRDIYAQRIDSNGNLMWGTNEGIAICNTTDYQYSPQICSDGAGGAIITWFDARPGGYVQRVDSDGNYLWGNNGSLFCENAGSRISINSDGQNGAVIAFSASTSTYVPQMYVQRIDSNNTRLWGINGTHIYSGEYMDKFPEYYQICTDQGGAIISWQVDDGSKYDVLTQKISAAGKALWGSNGETICNKASDTSREPFPEICSDGSGGAFITWMHDDNWTADIRAQRITSEASFPWTDPSIPFGFVHFLWIVISVLSLIIITKRKNLKFLNKK